MWAVGRLIEGGSVWLVTGFEAVIDAIPVILGHIQPIHPIGRGIGALEDATLEGHPTFIAARIHEVTLPYAAAVIMLLLEAGG